MLRGRSDLRRGLIAWTGDLGKLLTNAVLNSFPGLEDPALRELIKGGIADIRADLAPPGTLPLEALLAQRVATTWLAAYAADFEAECRGRAASPRESEAAQRRADRANRRFLASVKALAALRRTGPETLVQVINKGSVRVG